MRIFLNALGANTASGLTYLRNVLPQLSQRNDVQTTVAVSSELRTEFYTLRNIKMAALREPMGPARRFWFEQTRLPGILRETGTQVLISTGNFAMRKSPVPQILLSGNSLYTSRDFYRDLRRRHEYRMWLDTRLRAALAKRSVSWADCTVAPSGAFAEELKKWTGKDVVRIHHGFDPETFFRNQKLLPDETQKQVDAAQGELRLLHVSHYNYFRNFETLFRAIPLIRERLNGSSVRLFLTCKLQDGVNPGSYRTGSAVALAEKLGIRDEIVELGAIDYSSLHQLYRRCDVYVTASYAETFAHPLAEAMACGLRIVASDLPVHREVCGNSALYFPRFSPDTLAGHVMNAAALARPKPQPTRFSWREHVDQLLTLAARLAGQTAEKGSLLAVPAA